MNTPNPPPDLTALLRIHVPRMTMSYTPTPVLCRSFIGSPGGGVMRPLHPPLSLCRPVVPCRTVLYTKIVTVLPQCRATPCTIIDTPPPIILSSVAWSDQAEEYDEGGEGVAYHDSDAGNNGQVGVSYARRMLRWGSSRAMWWLCCTSHATVERPQH